MLIRHKPSIRPSEITPESRYLNRRGFIRSATLAGSSLLFTAGCSGADDANPPGQPRGDTGLNVNSFEDITSYNNFYEFGLDKEDPAKYSGMFKSRPWSVTLAPDSSVITPTTLRPSWSSAT